LQLALKSARDDDFLAADRRLQDSERFLPGSPQGRVLGMRIVELRQARTRDLLERGNAAVDRLRLDRADELLAQVAKIAAQPFAVDALRERIDLARHYGPFKPGQHFIDKLASGGLAPEMVVVRYGRFDMGAIEDDPERQDSELPAHPVEFKRGFAIARNEVTVGDFRRFVQATGYRTLATRAGHSTVYDEKGGVFSEHEDVDWQRDHVGRVAAPNLPVVHLSWLDAAAYTAWLSTETGRSYRLPSEAEFEYVLRAGSHGLYPWGSTKPTKVVGNLTGDGDLSRTGRQWSNAIPGYRDAFWGPAPVRYFPQERFGTFDMIGNVAEWTLDCWHDSYQRAPLDGSAWVNPGCLQRVTRGASWGSSLDNARSSARQPLSTETTTARLGFRVVREI
jgi:formylglycine-generating enzyme required for sulfatase activity